MAAFLSAYGVARHIYIPMVKRAVVDHAVGADWTPAGGDVKISKDGGTAANVTNLPAAIAMGNSTIWDFSLTATEMQAAQILVTIADSATKAVEDSFFAIETYANAAAQHVALPNVAPGAAGGLFMAGTNAATTITTGLTTHLIGTVDTVTTYTGNTPQTGDSYARLGAAGAGLTALGDTRLANLDAAVSSRSTYTGGAGTLTSGERTAIADAYLDRADAIEVGLTPRQAQRLEVAAAAGKLSGAATTTVTIRNAVADSKNRVIAVCDADGNRSAITVDVS